MRGEELDITNANEGDTRFLASPPSLICRCYRKMKAYGNHWRVVDSRSASYMNYDSGISVSEAGDGGRREDYVGELHHIIQLNYGSLNTPITLFMCEWKKRTDNMGRSTYKRDGDGFYL